MLNYSYKFDVKINFCLGSAPEPPKKAEQSEEVKDEKERAKDWKKSRLDEDDAEPQEGLVKNAYKKIKSTIFGKKCTNGKEKK